jgi:general stress protein CsbA
MKHVPISTLIAMSLQNFVSNVVELVSHVTINLSVKLVAKVLTFMGINVSVNKDFSNHHVLIVHYNVPSARKGAIGVIIKLTAHNAILILSREKVSIHVKKFVAMGLSIFTNVMMAIRSMGMDAILVVLLSIITYAKLPI